MNHKFPTGREWLTLPVAWLTVASFVASVHAQSQPADSKTIDQVQVSPVEPTKESPAEKKSAPEKESPAEKPFDLWTAPYLTGDWGGQRKELKDKGISLELFYNQQFQQNFRGGLETHNAQEFSGSYDLNFSLDFGKLGWIDDAGFFIRAAKGTWGDGINPNVGALFNPNSDAGGDQPIFINKWWLWKKFADKKIELRLGLLQTNKDLFDVSLYANHEDKDFLNRISIRNPTIPHGAGNGAFLKYQPNSWFYVQAIAFDAQHQPRTTGWNTAYHDRALFTTMGELGFTPNLKSAKGDLPGRYRLGAWYDPRSKTVFRDTLGGRREAETDEGDTGYYLGLDQMVWKENDDPKDSQGLGVFARYGHAHADRNRVSDAWQLGTSIKGLFPTRDQDVTGFAVSQGILSKRYRDDVNELADRETVYEVYYAWQVTPWMIVTPDLQFITNPGGNKDDRDAIVGGIRVRIIF